MSDIILEVKNISKQFSGIKALNNVSMSFRKGEIHAIAGENGAGKSTLIKILAGAISPTSGKILLDGTEYESLTPSLSITKGIAVIYQEFNLIPYLTVAENIFFGKEITKNGIRDVKSMNKRAKEMFDEMGLQIDPKTRVNKLGVAYMQLVEIIKAVSKDVRVLIMDEPSAPLTNREIEVMFKIMNKLKQKGVTIFYISHRLEEIFEICDRVSIMRDGNYIITKDVKDVNRKSLISYMVGHELGENYPRAKSKSEEVVLEVVNLYTSKLKDINFSLKKGEILGLGGLVGAGRTEIAKAIYGADHIISGKVILHGKEVKIKSPAKGLKNGIGLVPEDRKQEGLMLGMSIKKNITLSILKRISNLSIINSNKEAEICKKLKDDLRIKSPNLEQKVKNLSGGNQQKVVFAKICAYRCDILIFDEPTRGIDVGAKQEIYQLMRQLAEQGKSIIMISSEMPELIGMSDRILVMSEGKITAELEGEQITQEAILDFASCE